MAYVLWCCAIYMLYHFDICIYVGGLLVTLGNSGLDSLDFMLTRVTMYYCINLNWDGNLTLAVSFSDF